MILYYKMRQLLQNASILLQNATVTSSCDVIRNWSVQASKSQS